MKLLWRGSIFNPTGISTAFREVVKELMKKGVIIQTSDIWHSGFEFNKGLEKLNSAIDVKDVDYTIFADYPHLWREGYGKFIAYFLHEGTKLLEHWAEIFNTMPLIIVPSQATKNLFRFNGVTPRIEIVPFGVNPEIYKPTFGTNKFNLVPKDTKENKNEDFVFLSVNSWTGSIGDRKGTDILIKAFDEEFKPDEKVKLLLKISTFWRKQPHEFYLKAVKDITKQDNPNILVNSEYLPEEELVKHYQKSDCFVMPTRSESFGLTAINAVACGLPIIITKDNNSGYMDFLRGKDSVLWIDANKMEQADKQFFAEGNLQPIPEIDSLKKQMRYAFEHRELKEKAIKNSQEIRENWSWENSAIKLLKILNEEE